MKKEKRTLKKAIMESFTVKYFENSSTNKGYVYDKHYTVSDGQRQLNKVKLCLAIFSIWYALSRQYTCAGFIPSTNVIVICLVASGCILLSWAAMAMVDRDLNRSIYRDMCEEDSVRTMKKHMTGTVTYNDGKRVTFRFLTEVGMEDLLKIEKDRDVIRKYQFRDKADIYFTDFYDHAGKLIYRRFDDIRKLDTPE